MSPAPRTEARFPSVPAKAGHYESFYLKASDPAGGRAIWLRHTIHKRPGEEPTGAVWLTVFDHDAGAPRATKASYDAARISVPEGEYVRVGEASIGPGSASGSAAGAEPAASWDLRFDEGAPSLRHLQREFLYGSRLPKTKLLSPNPHSLFSGTVELGGERVELDAWPGMVGHNWGSEHAERWIWIQATGFSEDPGDYLDVALGRVKVGPMTTPWIANGRLVLGGEEHAVGGLGRAYGTEIEESPTGCEFTLPGRRINIKGTVSAARGDVVGWSYADPSGPGHDALNSSIADIKMRVERPGLRHARLSAEGTAVYELGTREHDHGIELQPYPDG